MCVRSVYYTLDIKILNIKLSTPRDRELPLRHILHPDKTGANVIRNPLYIGISQVFLGVLDRYVNIFISDIQNLWVIYYTVKATPQKKMIFLRVWGDRY